MMEKVYIISRYRARSKREQDFNIIVAQHFARQAVLNDKIPIAPHLYFTQFLDDSNEDERECGLGLGLHALRDCDEFLLVIIDGVISEGMRGEIRAIAKLGIPGRIVSLTRKEVIRQIKNSK